MTDSNLSNSLAFVFPGQGSQSVGMLAELSALHPGLRTTFEEASEGAGIDLWALSQAGPEAQLNRTEYTQPALLAAGVAVWRLWQQQGGAPPSVLAGHSLGEYTALVAAQALTLRDAAHLVRIRGQLMQAAAPAGTGAMAAVLGAEDALVQEVCDAVSGSEVVVPANYNSPGQIVIGGHAAAVDAALAMLAERGVRKTVKLAVSVPSHTPLMRDAANRLADTMAGMPWQLPSTPVVQNVDAQVHDSIDAIREALVHQLYLPGAVDRLRAGAGRARRGPDRRMRTGQGAGRAGETHRQITRGARAGYSGRLRSGNRGMETMSDRYLQGEIALVTGASRGIGAAIADELAALGATVIGTATSDAGALAIGERLAASGGHGRRLQVNEAGAIEALVDGVCSEFGGLSILVNNAGITRDNLLLRMKEEDWQAILDTNLTSVFRSSKAVLRGMMKARKGRIINIASVIGVTGNAGQSNYAAAKAGIIAFSKSLAKEIGSRGITVNVVAPGFIATDMTADLPEQAREAMLQQIALGRLGEPADIARAVAFLAGPSAAYITGETLHVNGGMYMP